MDPLWCWTVGVIHLWMSHGPDEDLVADGDGMIHDKVVLVMVICG